MTATSEAPSNDDADLPLGGVVEEIEAGTKKPGLIKSMPWLVRIAAVWLLLVFIAAASTTIFGWFGRDAPFLTDPNYNHFIFEGTGFQAYDRKFVPEPGFGLALAVAASAAPATTRDWRRD